MMVSTRGVKFKFTEGERVLCYEPDPSKAKVLYESKVLQLVVSRDNRGRKIPEYLVHFYGWNSSWDRCVAEDFVLPDNDENRNLQKRLSQEAAIQLKGKKKHKLNSLLKGSYNPCKKVNIERERKEAAAAAAASAANVTTHSDNDQSQMDSDSSDDEDEDEDEDEDDEKENDVEMEGGDDNGEYDEDEDFEDDEDENLEFIITIPDVLKDILEDDCFMITCKNKLVGLPCEPNVISILEGYVKHEAVSLVCASPLKGTRQQFSLNQTLPSDVETRIKIWKEVVDGLRIYFDFCLPTLLLYRQEKAQYNGIGSIKIAASSTRTKKLKDEMVHEPIEESHDPVPASPTPCVSAPTSPPRTTRHSRAAAHSVSPSNTTTKAVSRQYRKGSQSPTSSGEETTRRVLRSTDKSKFASEPKIETAPKETIENESPFLVSAPESPTLPQKILRHTLKSLSPTSCTTEPPKTATPTSNRVVAQTVPQSQPPVAAPNANQNSVSSVGSSASSTHSSIASSGVDGGVSHTRDTSGLLNDILSWQMVPLHVYERSSPLPSMIYGAHHLLRLFVKLPALMQKMNIPKTKRDHLQKELERFLRYLQDKREEFLVDSVYINQEQTTFE